MIIKEECYVGICDNCGEIFNDGEYSMFPLESDVKDQMENTEWFVGHPSDNEHSGKHYCDKCFKRDETIDDVIHVDLTRKKEQPAQSPKASEGSVWVSVKDELPSPSKEKKWQVYSPTTLGVTDGFYWGHTNAIDPCKGWSLQGVTHFKELPEPPKV